MRPKHNYPAWSPFFWLLMPRSSSIEEEGFLFWPPSVFCFLNIKSQDLVRYLCVRLVASNWYHALEHLHGNSPGDNVCKQTAKSTRFKSKILPIVKYFTTKLGLLLSQILGAQNITSICNIALSISDITTNNQRCDWPRCTPMSKKWKKYKSTRVAHKHASSRIHTIEPNRVYETVCPKFKEVF